MDKIDFERMLLTAKFAAQHESDLNLRARLFFVHLVEQVQSSLGSSYGDELAKTMGFGHIVSVPLHAPDLLDRTERRKRG